MDVETQDDGSRRDRPPACPTGQRPVATWAVRFGWQGTDYQIPAVANRLPYFLGGLTAFGILLQILTGIYLAQFYNPDPVGAHASVVYIVERAWLGDFLRSLHLWSANLVLASVTLHLSWIFWRGSYKPPREVTYWSGVLMLGLLFFLYFTGTVLKGDQEAVEALEHNIAAAQRAGAAGRLLLPEFTSSVPLHSRIFALHASVLPIALLGLVGLHLWLIRFLGLHTQAGEQEATTTFRKHLRGQLALGLLFFSAAGLLAVAWPAALLREGVPGVETTKPPFVFLWIYAVENFVGVMGLVLIPPAVYLLLFLPPLIDRKASALPRDRKIVLLAGFGLLLLLLGLALYAKLAPAQAHLHR